VIREGSKECSDGGRRRDEGRQFLKGIADLPQKDCEEMIDRRGKTAYEKGGRRLEKVGGRRDLQSKKQKRKRTAQRKQVAVRKWLKDQRRGKEVPGANRRQKFI